MKATLESQMSICLPVRQSVCHKNPSASQNCAYQPNLGLSQPSQYANQPKCQSATMPPSQNHNYWPSCLSAIMLSCLSAIMPIWPSDLRPAFATFKPFRLVCICKLHGLVFPASILYSDCCILLQHNGETS